MEALLAAVVLLQLGRLWAAWRRYSQGRGATSLPGENDAHARASRKRDQEVFVVGPGDLLTTDELALLDQITEVCNTFNRLDEHHPCERDEWVSTIHILQRQIMARAARRAYPDRFTAMVPNSAPPPFQPDHDLIGYLEEPDRRGL
jgi:DNA-binding SARP family transcriptional activator